MSWYLQQSRRFIVGLVTLLGVFWGSSRVDAADSVVLRYRFLRATVPISELTTLAETGEASGSLRTYLRMAGKEPEELQRTLIQEVPVNPTSLYRVLNSPPGELVLDRVSEVIHTPSNRANRQSLRGALVSSALSNGKITLIETLQNYPPPEVHVNGDRLAEFVQTINRIRGRLPNIEL